MSQHMINVVLWAWPKCFGSSKDLGLIEGLHKESVLWLGRTFYIFSKNIEWETSKVQHCRWGGFHGILAWLHIRYKNYIDFAVVGEKARKLGWRFT